MVSVPLSGTHHFVLLVFLFLFFFDFFLCDSLQERLRGEVSCFSFRVSLLESLKLRHRSFFRRIKVLIITFISGRRSRGVGGTRGGREALAELILII